MNHSLHYCLSLFVGAAVASSVPNHVRVETLTLLTDIKLSFDPVRRGEVFLEFAHSSSYPMVVVARLRGVSVWPEYKILCTA